MWHGRRAKAAEICAHAAGAGVLIMLVLAEPTALTLSLAVALAPFTLAMALSMIAEIRDNLADEKISAIVADLLINAPRTILGSWGRVLGHHWKRARPSTGCPRS